MNRTSDPNVELVVALGILGFGMPLVDGDQVGEAVDHDLELPLAPAERTWRVAVVVVAFSVGADPDFVEPFDGVTPAATDEVVDHTLAMDLDSCGVGGSQGAPRRHFADKQALLDALAVEGFTRLGAEFESARSSTSRVRSERAPYPRRRFGPSTRLPQKNKVVFFMDGTHS